MMACRERLRQALVRSHLWQRWQLLPERDRKALLALLLFFAVVLFYLLLWQPVSSWRERARADFERQRELHHYIQSNAALARQSQRSDATRLSPDRLQGEVAASAQKIGLTLERFDNEGAGALLVTLNQVPFVTLVRWLGQLQEQGVVLFEANLDSKSNGRVDARLTLGLEQG